jgi:hypothetical protein
MTSEQRWTNFERPSERLGGNGIVMLGAIVGD